MRLKVGKKVTFKDIEVGEVFAWEGCWSVGYKVDEVYAIRLADDYAIYRPFEYGKNERFFYEPVYRLPKGVQALWLGA